MGEDKDEKDFKKPSNKNTDYLKSEPDHIEIDFKPTKKEYYNKNTNKKWVFKATMITTLIIVLVGLMGLAIKNVVRIVSDSQVQEYEYSYDQATTETPYDTNYYVANEVEDSQAEVIVYIGSLADKFYFLINCMTLNQVEEILGEKGELEYSTPYQPHPREMYIWEDSDSVLMIIFEDGMLVDKTLVDANLVWTDFPDSMK